jgi:hypothetical protein
MRLPIFLLSEEGLVILFIVACVVHVLLWGIFVLGYLALVGFVVAVALMQWFLERVGYRVEWRGR